MLLADPSRRYFEQQLITPNVKCVSLVNAISSWLGMRFLLGWFGLQAWFMDQDLDMYHEATDTPSKVRTMNLNEDLGQVSDGQQQQQRRQQCSSIAA